MFSRLVRIALVTLMTFIVALAVTVITEHFGLHDRVTMSILVAFALAVNLFDRR